MTEIPEDIMQTARLVEDANDGAGPNACVGNFARALFAERRATIERCAARQPSTAEDPNESDYQRGRFDGIIEFAAAIRETAR